MEPDSEGDGSQELLKHLPFIGNHPIPPVDPADMKALWQQAKDAEAQAKIDAEGSKPAVMMVMSREAAACSPAADLPSVIFRLWMLDLANRAMGLNFPVTPDGKPTDVVFKAFATIPMTGMTSGGSNSPPFDVFELVKTIVKESEA